MCSENSLSSIKENQYLINLWISTGYFMSVIDNQATKIFRGLSKSVTDTLEGLSMICLKLHQNGEVISHQS